MKVPFNDLSRGFKLYQEEYERATIEVLRSGYYILGNQVEAFEEEFAKMLDCSYCVGIDNGLDAIALGIHALGIGKGDEVILQSNAYIATVLGVTINSVTPVFVEPDEYFNIDADLIEQKITNRTKALLVTHLYGQSSNMDKLVDICKRYNIFLLEDCAQSHLAQYNDKYTGSFGEIGFFSFYPTKNLGGFGDGGAIVTNNSNIANKIRMLRNYGSNKKYHNEVRGVNARLDELQAALLRVKLSHLKELTQERKVIADKYLKGVHNPYVTLPIIRDKATHVWHLFVVKTALRDRFREYLLQNGIKTEVHYPIPVHMSNAYKELGYKKGDFPVAEIYSERVVSLPLFNGMSNEEVEFVINKINHYQQ